MSLVRFPLEPPCKISTRVIGFFHILRGVIEIKLNSRQIKYCSKITNSLYDDFKLEFLYHSNHLEGSTFSKKELNKLLTEKKVQGNHFLIDVIETINSLALFDQVIDDSDQKLDKFMLFHWHRILKKGTVDDEIHNIGIWKKFENKLKGVDLKLASPMEVDNLIYNLLTDWYETKDITIKDIADFHYKFEQIHPFQDGNGRIGRFIILKQCIEENIDFIAIDEAYEEEYKKALFLAQKTKNSEKLVEVFKKCQKRLDEKLKFYQDLMIEIKKMK